MSNEIKNRKEQILDSFADNGADAVTEWGNDFIKTNIPKSLDLITSYIKEFFSSVTSKNNLTIKENIRNAIYTGIEVGEKNKEQALIKAMKVEGIDEGEIKIILEKSSQYLITSEEKDINKQ